MSYFVEICVYEIKPGKTDEFEALVQDVAKHHRSFAGIKMSGLSNGLTGKRISNL